MRGQKTMQAQETKWIQEIMQIQKMMQGQEMMRAGRCSKGVAAGTVEASPWPAWSIASRSTPRDQRKGCSELRPRSHAWTKPQPVFPWSLAPAMIPSSLPLSAKLCKMNTGNSSENTQLFTQLVSRWGHHYHSGLAGSPGWQGGGMLPGGKGRLGVHGLEAGGQWLPPLSAPLGPWRLIVGFPGRGLDWVGEFSVQPSQAHF